MSAQQEAKEDTRAENAAQDLDQRGGDPWAAGADVPCATGADDPWATVPAEENPRPAFDVKDLETLVEAFGEKRRPEVRKLYIENDYDYDATAAAARKRRGEWLRPRAGVAEPPTSPDVKYLGTAGQQQRQQQQQQQQSRKRRRGDSDVDPGGDRRRSAPSSKEHDGAMNGEPHPTKKPRPVRWAWERVRSAPAWSFPHPRAL